MEIGKLQMRPDEARSKAQELQRIALNIEDLLNNVSLSMQDINDSSKGMYQGQKKPAQLRAELDDFRATFSRTYNQIMKFSSDIIAITNTAENE